MITWNAMELFALWDGYEPYTLEGMDITEMKLLPSPDGDGNISILQQGQVARRRVIVKIRTINSTEIGYYTSLVTDWKAGTERQLTLEDASTLQCVIGVLSPLKKAGFNVYDYTITFIGEASE